MAVRPATFKQIDVTRATKGVVAAGQAVERVEIDAEGKIVIFLRGTNSVNGANPCDALLK